MRATLSLLGLLIVLGVAYFIYKGQLTHGPGGASPVQQIDMVGVRSELLSIAQAERRYLASHGSYASIDQLQQEGSIAYSGSSRGYSYEAEVDDGQHFKITAAPSDPSRQGWPTFSIDETMQISQK